MNICIVIDNSLSMLQVSESHLSLLECAKSVAENFINSRLRISSNSIGAGVDRFYLLTSDSNQEHRVISDIRHEVSHLVTQLRLIQPSFDSNLLSSISQCFSLLNKFRLLSNSDNYIGGRDPSHIDPSAIVIISDFSDELLAGQLLYLVEGAKVNRWDYQVHCVPLTMKGRSRLPRLKKQIKISNEVLPLLQVCNMTGGNVFPLVSFLEVNPLSEKLAHEIKPKVTLYLESLNQEFTEMVKKEKIESEVDQMSMCFTITKDNSQNKQKLTESPAKTSLLASLNSSLSNSGSAPPRISVSLFPRTKRGGNTGINFPEEAYFIQRKEAEDLEYCGCPKYFYDFSYILTQNLQSLNLPFPHELFPVDDNATDLKTMASKYFKANNSVSLFHIPVFHIVPFDQTIGLFGFFRFSFPKSFEKYRNTESDASITSIKAQFVLFHLGIGVLLPWMNQVMSRFSGQNDSELLEKAAYQFKKYCANMSYHYQLYWQSFLQNKALFPVNQNPSMSHGNSSLALKISKEIGFKFGFSNKEVSVKSLKDEFKTLNDMILHFKHEQKKSIDFLQQQKNNEYRIHMYDFAECCDTQRKQRYLKLPLPPKNKINIRSQLAGTQTFMSIEPKSNLEEDLHQLREFVTGSLKVFVKPSEFREKYARKTGKVGNQRIRDPEIIEREFHKDHQPCGNPFKVIIRKSMVSIDFSESESALLSQVTDFKNKHTCTTEYYNNMHDKVKNYKIHSLKFNAYSREAFFDDLEPAKYEKKSDLGSSIEYTKERMLIEEEETNSKMSIETNRGTGGIVSQEVEEEGQWDRNEELFMSSSQESLEGRETNGADGDWNQEDDEHVTKGGRKQAKFDLKVVLGETESPNALFEGLLQGFEELMRRKHEKKGRFEQEAEAFGSQRSKESQRTISSVQSVKGTVERLLDRHLKHKEFFVSL